MTFLHGVSQETWLPLQVVRIIDNEAVPLLRRCSLAGHATLKSPARVFTDHPLAADMCIDILSDRGTLTSPPYLQGLGQSNCMRYPFC